MQLAMKYKRGFTLVEIMVVVAIVALMAVLTLPSIRAMQASSARALTNNIINSALQGARSYAIMHGCNTAARFQPNGKIFLVYKVTKGNSNIRAAWWTENYTTTKNPFPPPNFPVPNPDPNQSYIYLPVINQEPLELPRGYAIANLTNTNSFQIPFYICYTPAGILAPPDEPIWVGLTTNNGRPINPDFNGDGNPIWNTTDFVNVSSGAPVAYYDAWATFANKPIEVVDTDDRKLARYYNVILDTELGANDIEQEKKLNDPDHFGGLLSAPNTPVTTPSVSQVRVFPTPDNWDQLPIFSSDPTNTKTRAYMVRYSIDSKLFDPIHINPYTGRIIRPVE